MEEVKRRTRCSRCLQLGHWLKECHNPPAPGRTAAGGSKSTDKEKEFNFVYTDEIKFCGFLEKSLDDATTDLKDTETAKVAQLTTDDQVEVPLEAMMMDQLEEPRRRPPVEMPREEMKLLENMIMESPQLVDRATELNGDELNGDCGAEELLEQESERGGPEPFLNLLHEEQASLVEPTGAAALEVYMCEPDEIFRFDTMLCGTARLKNPQPADTAYATIDTGCHAEGLNTLRMMSQHLPAPLKVKTQQQAFRFRSVNGVSTTERVGIAPASLGESGCFLRPALFEDEHGADAPFLLSLPLLMHCGATLQLCPEDGLYLLMKRSRRRIPCHLGPTDSLRVPIFAFTRRMLKALITQEVDIADEFEVLTTAPFESQALSDTTPRPPDGGIQQEATQRSGLRDDQGLEEPTSAASDGHPVPDPAHRGPSSATSGRKSVTEELYNVVGVLGGADLRRAQPGGQHSWGTTNGPGIEGWYGRNGSSCTT